MGHPPDGTVGSTNPRSGGPVSDMAACLSFHSSHGCEPVRSTMAVSLVLASWPCA